MDRELYIAGLPDEFLDRAESEEAAVRAVVESFGKVQALCVTRSSRSKNTGWALVKFAELGAAEAAVQSGVVAKDCSIFDPARGTRETTDVPLELRLGIKDPNNTSGVIKELSRQDVIHAHATMTAQILFRTLDKEGRGHLSSYKVQSRLGDLGMSSQDVDRVFHVLDADMDGAVSFSEWMTILAREKENPYIQDMVERVQAAA